MTKSIDYIRALLHLIYPSLCASCKQVLAQQENCICSSCLFKLPYTNYHLISENPLEKIFWGRIKIEEINSLLFFEKASKTQHLMHNLKYKGDQDIGIKLAQLVWDKYKNANKPIVYEVLTCVPLHKQKLKIRGYNQCSSFARELSKLWQIPFYPEIIIRKHNNTSQTKKNRISRWENVDQIFAIPNNKALKNKHILLIDDIITTGATLEACGQELLLVEGSKLSILTMACTV